MIAEALTAPALAGRHGFFTRRGGVSTGPYASLNASLSSGDDPARVAENRARIAAALGVAADRLLGLRQVHGTRVIMPDAPWAPGQGPDADALVSNTPGLALGVVTADCAPVLLRDAAAGVAAVAHAGWRGAAAGVLEATVDAMRRLGARAIAAAVGPCIAQASYEVGQDLVSAVPGIDPFLAPGAWPGKWQFDLPGYVAARLAAAGVTVQVLGVDTLADDARFFSHRRRTLRAEAAIGHQLSAIVV